MSEVRSTFQLKRGAEAPDFQLPEGGKNESYSLRELAEGREAVVIVFACNHCPFVKYLAPHIGEIAREFSARGVQFVAINSNDATAYPKDAAEHMPAFAVNYGWDFPYLQDDSQAVAKAYAAACTPDFYVFNAALELTYTGQFDGARPGNHVPVTGADLRVALESTLREGHADSISMRPSSGCNIKWREGEGPDYFVQG